MVTAVEGRDTFIWLKEIHANNYAHTLYIVLANRQSKEKEIRKYLAGQLSIKFSKVAEEIL
jgi:hypothetical protein